MKTDAIEWDRLAPGFADPIHDSQATFRRILEALARPGTIETVPPTRTHAPGGIPMAAYSILLALCDFSTPVWYAEDEADVTAALRFHVGAPVAAEPRSASFAWVRDPSRLPPLDQFDLGEPEVPERSTTLVLGVDGFQAGGRLRLSGPGIQSHVDIAVPGLRTDFWRERRALGALFPTGLDILLVCDDRVLGLPRTTRVEEL